MTPTAYDVFPLHGGDLAFASRVYGAPAEGWIDLSTGINPDPYPLAPLARADLTRLPDPAALASLVAAARRAYGIVPDVTVAAVPGTDIAIRLIPPASPPATVAVVSPTYASHADAWRDARHRIVPIAAANAVPDDAAFVVIGNPNNPNGHSTPPNELAALALRLGARGGFLVVDEAFGDVAPDLTLAPHLAGLPAVILRSLGKFYGLAGLRLGFVAGHEPVVARVAATLGAWPVSGPAIAAGTAALADDAWRDMARLRLHATAMRYRGLLASRGFLIAGGTDLFVFVRHDNAAATHAHLARAGIWTRAFADMPTHLRFGLPDDAGFARLDRALGDLP